MKKILIANAVPTNNGDAALIFGLYNKLVKEGYEVIISTTRYETVKKLYPNIKWVKAEYDFNKIERKFCSKFPSFRKKLIKFKVLNNKQYKDIDAIISAPGGYINSYYGFEEKLYCMNLIKEKYNTKLVMYSQSVGPLNNYDVDILDKYIKSFDLFMVRDEVSYNNVKKYDNVYKTNDAAFLLDLPEHKNSDSNKVAISVREWAHDGRSRSKYIDLIKGMVYKCIDNGYKVEFISTCQGLSNYIDDSKIAQQIKDELDEKYQASVEVNNKYYSLEQLREYIKGFRFVVGTRLHMCILTIMSGIPAFNISYEVKGKECYKILNLNEYSVDYNDDINDSLEKLQQFINKNDELKEVYENKALEMNEEANNHLKYMLDTILK